MRRKKNFRERIFIMETKNCKDCLSQVGGIHNEIQKLLQLHEECAEIACKIEASTNELRRFLKEKEKQNVNRLNFPTYDDYEERIDDLARRASLIIKDIENDCSVAITRDFYYKSSSLYMRLNCM